MGQDELGQYDYGFRFYDPVIARWNVIDPMAENHYDTNPYHYVLNNPMLYMDYMGLDTTYNGGRLKEVKITGPAKGNGSGNSYYGYGSGWGGYDPFDTDNGYGSGDFGSFSMTFTPPPPPVLSSSAAPNKALDNRGNVSSSREIFYGVPIYTIKSLPNGAAFTLPHLGIFVNQHTKGQDRIDLLRHEYGHILQGARYGNQNFYTLVVPASLFSATRSTLMTNYAHQEFWTEMRANDLSYNFFGKPANWNAGQFPLTPPPPPPLLYNNVSVYDALSGLGSNGHP